MDQYLYFGSLGLHERQYQIPNFIGLALEPAHDREIWSISPSTRCLSCWMRSTGC